MIRILLFSITLTFLLCSCNSEICKQLCIEEGLDNDCCPKIDSTDLFLPASSIKEINIFLETSGSMEGYMPNLEPATNFQKIIPTIIEKIGILYPIKLNFYSIFDTKHPFSKLNIPTAREKILYGKFEWNGNTYIPEMLDSVSRYLDYKSVNLFISDCIYSPVQEDKKQMEMTKTDIWKIVSKNANSFSTTFFCLYSEFISEVFPSNNSPYYIVLQGAPQNIRLIESIIYQSINDAKQEFKEIYFGLKYARPYYSVLPYSETSANFIAMPCSLFNDAFISIQEIDLDQDGNQLKFWLGIDLKDYPHYVKDIHYLEKNLSIKMDNVPVEILSLQTLPYSGIVRDDQVITNNCTHIFQVRVSDLKSCISKINISLKYTIPDWKMTQNDSVDENNREKTYRLTELIEGFEQAYCPDNSNEYFFKDLEISLIKK